MLFLYNWFEDKFDWYMYVINVYKNFDRIVINVFKFNGNNVCICIKLINYI